MSAASAQGGISAPYGIALLFVLFAVILSVAYALITRNLLVWIAAVATVARVLAVERIAADS